MASMNTEIKDFISTMTAFATDLHEKEEAKLLLGMRHVEVTDETKLAQMRPDSRDKEIGELIRKRAIDAQIIALLKEQLKDYKQNGANAEELDEMLQAREEEVLDSLYDGGEFDEEYHKIIDIGREQFFEELRAWAKRAERG